MREGGLVPVQRGEPSDFVLVIGTAVDGPDGIPVPVATLQEAMQSFGPATYDAVYTPVQGKSVGDFNGNTLVRDIDVLIKAGVNNILAVRVGGTYANVDVEAGTPPQKYFLARGLFKGAFYNDKGSPSQHRCGIEISAVSGGNVTLNILQPPVRGGNVQLTVPATTKLPVVMDLVNNHPNNLTIILEKHPNAPSGFDNAEIQVLAPSSGTSTFALASGKDGTKMDSTFSSIYTALTDPTTGVFNTLEGVAVDNILMTALYADDLVDTNGTTSVVGELARFVARISESHPCHAFIGCQPLSSRTAGELKQKVVESYLASGNPGVVDPIAKRIKIGPFMRAGALSVGTGASTIQYGQYVSVVAGLPAVMASDTMRRFVDTPTAAYAGLASVISVSDITAFQKLPTILNMAGPKLPSQTIDALCKGVYDGTTYGGAYVVIERSGSVGGDIIVIEDPTAADRTAVFSHLSTSRIANSVSRGLKSGLRQFLGKPNTADTITAMATVVRAVLDRMAEIQALVGGEGVGYRFTIVPSGQGLQMTQVQVKVDMRPSAYIRSISIEVTVRP